MLTGIKRIILADVSSGEPNPATGDRKKQVSKAKVIAGIVELVGVNTAQLGQLQGFTLSCSVEVPRVQYGSEKYLYFDSQIYEIKTFGKAKTQIDMLLNVQKLEDKEVQSAVEEWINANL